MFRVMTLNLRFGLAHDGPNAWPHRKKAFPPLFSSYPADLYCFQEANDFQLKELTAWLPGHRPIGIRHPAPRFWQHNPIYAPISWHVLHWERLYLSPTPEIPSRQRTSKWPRQCTIGHFSHDGGDVICINTHFDFAPETQQENARIIARRLERYPAATPCLLVGDFNAGPGGACHRLLTGGQWMPGRRLRSAFGSKPPGSFHGFSGTTSGKHIDWILVDRGLRVVSARAVTQAVDGIYPSDHFPVLAAVEHRGSRSAAAEAAD